ncbi:MAG: Holliday junction branch migration protein RuvA [Bacteroidales bacterium]|nr:Holliday junction branch migration protein RuvA [Bacteroidales bacterium]
MIDYIKGKITQLSPTQVVIESGGVGYISEISLQSYQEFEGKEDSVVYIQTQVNTRDGSSIDYGFSSRDERELFRLITGISGMGAASARMMLSSMSSDEIREAILAEDVVRIKSIKGLGIKTAQRLILELKDKLIKGEGSDASSILFANERNAVMEEATSALQMLGFNKAAINKALQKLIKEKPDAKVEQLIKSALQIL